MKASKLFLLLVFTALSVFLWSTKNAALCAIAVITTYGCIMGWYELIRDVEETSKIKS